MGMAFITVAALAYITMSIIFGLGRGGDQPPSAAIAPTVANWPTSTPDPEVANFPRISVAALKQLLDSKANIQILDNSSDEEFNKAHLPGAVHFQLADITLRSGELDPNRPIVLYCNCTAEQVSITVGRALRARGFSDLRVLQGGLKGWQQAGYAVIP